jgi:hypothetical protein
LVVSFQNITNIGLGEGGGEKMQNNGNSEKEIFNIVLAFDFVLVIIRNDILVISILVINILVIMHYLS